MHNTPASSGGTEGLAGERVPLVTKLAMPPLRSDLVARPRLVNQLSLGIQRPLTLIAAPAGFGKTTLLSSSLEHAALRSAWLSLEQDDNDLTRFWSYVFAALARIHPYGVFLVAHDLARIQRLQGQLHNAQVEAFAAWLSFMQGDEAAVSRWQERCDLTLDGDISHVREREYLTLVRFLLSQRRLDEARRWLASLLQLAEAQGRTGSVIELLMLQAEALYASGEVNEAMKPLERSLALAEPEGYIRLFMDEGVPMAHLLEQMRRAPGDQPGSTRYREHLLAELHRAGHASYAPVAAPGSGMDLLGEALSERELEVLRLIAAGYSNREIADRLVIAVSTA